MDFLAGGAGGGAGHRPGRRDRKTDWRPPRMIAVRISEIDDHLELGENPAFAGAIPGQQVLGGTMTDPNDLGRHAPGQFSLWIPVDAAAVLVAASKVSRHERGPGERLEFC